ncbi:MAG: serine/threonine protein kinase [Deltaproteobacteria bacterium]|nr:serine/threonine protein kinase [Deltaproteobacteria bacterium]
MVTIIDYGETDDGDVFMAMEYLDGKPLYRVLQECGPFPARRALNVAIQVVRALRRAHSMGVVHRDLKPANIMLRPDDDDLDFVKVLDFGLVKVFAPEAAEADGITDEHLTSVGAMMGTPGYMAPEQAVGERVDGRADLYSLGVILFQLLTGRLPFEGDSIVDLITAQVMKPVPFVRELEPDVECPDELEAIVHRCLHRNRSERYANADELLAAFKSVWRLETDHSFGTETSLPPYRPMPEQFTVRSAAPVSGPLVEVDEAALPVVPLERSSYAQAPAVPRRPPPPPPTKLSWWLLPAAVALAVLVGAGLALLRPITPAPAAASVAPGGGLVDLPDDGEARAPARPSTVRPAPVKVPVVPVNPAPATKVAPEEDPEEYKGNPY